MAQRLGEYLINQNAINEAELEAALEDQSSAMTHRFLGDIFIEKQILSKEDFHNFLESFLREKAAEADEEELRLGNLLMDAGLINAWDLEALLGRQKELGGDVPLGELLVEGGYITTSELEVFLSNQQVMRS